MEPDCRSTPPLPMPGTRHCNLRPGLLCVAISSWLLPSTFNSSRISSRIFTERVRSCHSVKTLLGLLKFLQSEGQSLFRGLCSSSLTSSGYSPLTAAAATLASHSTLLLQGLSCAPPRTRAVGSVLLASHLSNRACLCLPAEACICPCLLLTSLPPSLLQRRSPLLSVEDRSNARIPRLHQPASFSESPTLGLT